MPRFVRLAAPILAVAAIALGGATSALAAAPTSAGPGTSAPSTYRWDLDESWCFVDGSWEYCFDVTGSAQFVDGTRHSQVVTDERFHTVIRRDGAYVGESTVTSVDRFAFSDSTYVQQGVSHTRSVYGTQTCSIQLVWVSRDFSAVVDHLSGGCVNG